MQVHLYRIIDKITSQPITDFSIVNPNADLDNGDHGLFNLWSYTMGVTYVGMLKAGEATRDSNIHTISAQEHEIFL